MNDLVLALTTPWILGGVVIGSFCLLRVMHLKIALGECSERAALLLGLGLVIFNAAAYRGWWFVWRILERLGIQTDMEDSWVPILPNVLLFIGMAVAVSGLSWGRARFWHAMSAFVLVSIAAYVMIRYWI